MTDQTESASEHAELLADLEFYDEDHWRNVMRQYPGAQDAIRKAAAAIRALEAELGVARGQFRWSGKALEHAAKDRDRLADKLRSYEAEVIGLSDALGKERDRSDRLAGEVFNLRADVMQWQTYFKTMVEFSAHNHARLTSELNALRSANDAG